MSTESTVAASSVTSSSAPASSAWSATPVAAPLTLRKDTDDGFPIGGAVLLIVLMVAAVWAWWYGRARAGSPSRLPALAGSLWGRPAAGHGDLRIVEAVVATGGMRLMVVEWAGGRRVLVATTGTNAPITLDVVPGATDPSEVTP